MCDSACYTSYTHGTVNPLLDLHAQHRTQVAFEAAVPLDDQHLVVFGRHRGNPATQLSLHHLHTTTHVVQVKFGDTGGALPNKSSGSLVQVV